MESLATRVEAVPANRDLRVRVAARIEQVARDPEGAAAAIRAALDRLGLDPLRVPGLFWRSHPETGAHLEVVETWLGRPVALVETGETDPVEAGAGRVAEAVRRVAGVGRRALVVSASKGSADVRAALEADPALGGGVAIWLDLVGVLEGTPLTDPGTDSGQQALEVLPEPTAKSMSHAERARAAAPGRFPVETRAVHVAAFPRVRDVSVRARSSYEALRPRGPNDGYVLLDAYLRAPGRVLVMRGVDHYLRIEGLASHVAALLLVLFDELDAAEGPPHG